MELVIAIGLISAITAALACQVIHAHAERHAWKEMRRYTAGAATWLAFVAAPLFASVPLVKLPIEIAILLYGMDWLIIGAMGLSVAIAYGPPPALPRMEDDDS